MRKLFTIILLGCCASSLKAQQHPVYAQYLFNGMIINPAYSSMDEAASATVTMRNQWVGMEGAPRTATFAFYTPVKATNTSLGLLALNDQITVYSQTGVQLNVSQKIKLDNKHYFALGIRGGMAQFRENNALLYAQDDPVFAQNQQYWKTDVGFGISVHSEKFFLALSAPSFHSFDLGSSVNKVEFRRHVYFQGAMITSLNKDVRFRPSILLRHTDGAGAQVDLSAAFLIRNIVWAGATWRTEKTAAAMMQIQVTKNLQIGYAYDFASVSYLKGMQSGSHEMMLNYRFSTVKGKPVEMKFF